MPFWDETSEESRKHGIPWALTCKSVKLAGQSIPNPLRSFKFTAAVVDHIPTDKPVYSKPKGYETVRYPLSGLVGTPGAKKASEAHNAPYLADDKCAVAALNQNVIDWLAGTEVLPKGTERRGAAAEQYRACLDVPTYTLFSNRTSASEEPAVVSLEMPHDSMHLAVGGFDVPKQHDSPIPEANGDMGEPDTAGFDPIFFFHHSFVDRVFWLRQHRHGSTERLDIEAGYPGTNSSDPGQGPTPGIEPHTALNLKTPLYPFTKDDETPYTSADCINIETDLGYRYGPGSLEDLPAPTKNAAPRRPVIKVSGNRAKIHGSFVISAFGNSNGGTVHLGSQGIFNRWNVDACTNCQSRLEVKAFIDVPPAASGLIAGVTEDMLSQPSSYRVQVRTHDGVIEARQTGQQPAENRAEATDGEPDFRFEIL